MHKVFYFLLASIHFFSRLDLLIDAGVPQMPKEKVK